MGRKSMIGTAVGGAPAKDQTRRRIERMEAEREERRRAMQERKLERAEEEERNIKKGNPGDVDFIGLVDQWREDNAGLEQPRGDPVPLKSTDGDKINVCVRKRPLNEKEQKKLEHDAVTCFHPTATVHSAKLKVDGINKYCDHNSFCFDHVFDENSTTEEVYMHSAKPLVGVVCCGRGVRATVFAYGQTGSGKTHTMAGIQQMVADELFQSLENNIHNRDPKVCTMDNTTVSIAIFELYGGRIQDLLNKRNRLKVLEDGKGEVVVAGLEEFAAEDPEDFLSLLETGHSHRTTHATEANDVSSRSHAICQISLRDRTTGRLKGKFSLVDLAGSERGTDTKSHNRQRRTESSEINTSLLALKECIRAIDSDSKHVPYRQSKLTLILKDCFTSKLARTAMIATLSPGSLSTDHTVNTLRYADRIKEKKVNNTCVRDNRSMRSPTRREAEKIQQKRKSPCRNPSAPKPVPSISEEVPYDLDEFDDLDDFDELDMIFNVDKSESEINGNEPDKMVVEHNRAVETLQEEQDGLVNKHMDVIQKQAELLLEEGNLLELVQGEDFDIDMYASRLGKILDRKTVMTQELQENLASVREHMRIEEDLSKKIAELSTSRF